jgi:hypothetical protein
MTSSASFSTAAPLHGESTSCHDSYSPQLRAVVPPGLQQQLHRNRFVGMREAPRSPLEAPIGSTLYRPSAVRAEVPEASARTLCTISVGVAGADGRSRDGLRRSTAAVEHGAAGSVDRRGRGTPEPTVGTGLTGRLSIRRGPGGMFGGISCTDPDAADVMPTCASSPLYVDDYRPSLHSQQGTPFSPAQEDGDVGMQDEVLAAPAGSHEERGPVLRPRPQPVQAPSPADYGPSPIPGNLQERLRIRKQQLKRNGNWSTESLKAAIRAVEEGCKIREVARHFDIPASSLADHVHGRTLTRKRGRGGVLTDVEEHLLVDWMLKMANLGYPVNMGELKAKVFELTQTRPTPFTDGIPGSSWVKWFRRRHPYLTLRSSQGLELARARGMCPENVSTFYENLKLLYTQHNYAPDHIWNCDETGAQAGRSGGGRVFARKGVRNVHTVIPNEREWLSVLSCINASGGHIPNFYIFKGKQMRRNFLQLADPGDTMAMQAKAWMTSYLFDSWISHFILALQRGSGISPSNRHVLVLDGHISHVSLSVVTKAGKAGLDIVSLPSHTSHHLQPLDVAVFRPFKCAFRSLRDAWTMRHRGHPAKKEDLCQWVCLALRRALSPSNIQKGFQKTGIWPLNPSAVADKMGPSSAFVPGEIPQYEPTDDEDDPMDSTDPLLEEVVGDRILSSQNEEQPRFYVPIEIVGRFAPPGDSGSDSEGDIALQLPNEEADRERDRFRGLLQLPHIGPPPARSRREEDEPAVDFSKSVLLTSDAYITMMREKMNLKEAAAKEREERRQQAAKKKAEREASKAQQEAEKLQKAADAVALKAFKANWSTDAIRDAGQDLWDRLHAIHASILPLTAGPLRPAPILIPKVCLDNQRYRKAMMWAKKSRPDLLNLIPCTSAPSGAHLTSPASARFLAATAAPASSSHWEARLDAQSWM